MIDSVRVQVLGRDDFLDDELHHVTANLLQRGLGQVLRGDNDGVHANRDAGAVIEMVFARDLHVNSVVVCVTQ